MSVAYILNVCYDAVYSSDIAQVPEQWLAHRELIFLKNKQGITV